METTDKALVLSVEEARHLLKLSRSAIYALVEAKTVRSVRAGRRILIPNAAIAEYLAPK